MCVLQSWTPYSTIVHGHSTKRAISGNSPKTVKWHACSAHQKLTRISARLFASSYIFTFKLVSSSYKSVIKGKLNKIIQHQTIMQDTVSGDRAARLFELLQRQDVPRQIHNIIGKMALLFEAALYDERLEFIAEKTSWVTIEIGSRGVFEGVDGARRCLVDIERTFEKSHTAGMRKAFPGV